MRGEKVGGDVELGGKGGAEEGAASREGSLLPLGALGVALVAVVERILSVLDGPETYVLCFGWGPLGDRLDHELSLNRWLLLAAVVVAVAGVVASRVRRHWRVLPALALPAVLILVVLSDGHVARADAVAAQLSATQSCDEPTAMYNTSPGWFDWNPFD